MTSRANRITRQSKTRTLYRSLAPNFALLPLTGELATITNEAAIKAAIKNVIFTIPGERFYHPDIGSTVTHDVFEFVDDFTMDRIRETVLHTLQVYEPRATNPRIDIISEVQNNLIYVNIYFTIAALSEEFAVNPITLRVR